jgi:hypothetical protein
VWCALLVSQTATPTTDKVLLVLKVVFVYLATLVRVRRLVLLVLRERSRTFPAALLAQNVRLELFKIFQGKRLVSNAQLEHFNLVRVRLCVAHVESMQLSCHKQDQLAFAPQITSATHHKNAHFVPQIMFVQGQFQERLN